MSQRFLTRANCLHTIFVTKIFAFYVFTDFRIWKMLTSTKIFTQSKLKVFDKKLCRGVKFLVVSAKVETQSKLKVFDRNLI